MHYQQLLRRIADKCNDGQIPIHEYEYTNTNMNTRIRIHEYIWIFKYIWIDEYSSTFECIN